MMNILDIENPGGIIWRIEITGKTSPASLRKRFCHCWISQKFRQRNFPVQGAAVILRDILIQALLLLQRIILLQMEAAVPPERIKIKTQIPKIIPPGQEKNKKILNLTPVPVMNRGRIWRTS